CRDVDELAHDRVPVRRGVDPLHIRLSEKLAAQLSALLVGLALGHQSLLILAWITAAAQPFRAMSRSVSPDGPCRNDRVSSSIRPEGLLRRSLRARAPESSMSRSRCRTAPAHRRPEHPCPPRSAPAAPSGALARLDDSVRRRLRRRPSIPSSNRPRPSSKRDPMLWTLLPRHHCFDAVSGVDRLPRNSTRPRPLHTSGLIT